MGTRKSPKYECHACHMAKRALEGQCRGDAAAKRYLHTMRATDPEGYRAKVRDCRIRTAAGGTGVATIEERTVAIGKLVRQITHSVSVEDTVEAVWLLQQQFVKHYMDTEDGCTRDKAERLWAIAVNDGDVRKRGKGTELRCAVLLPPKTVATRRRTTSTVVEATEGLRPENEANVLQRARLEMAQATPIMPGMADAGGDVFDVGAAMGSGGPLQSVGGSTFATEVRTDGLLPAAPLIPALPPARVGEATGPPLKRRASAPKSPAPRKRGGAARAKSIGEATGEVLEARQAAAAMVKANKTAFVCAYANPTYGLVKLRTAGRIPDIEWATVAEQVASYKAKCAELVKIGEEVGHWTLPTAKEGRARLESLCADLATDQQVLQTFLDRVRTGLRTAVVAKASANRVAARHGQKATAVLAERCACSAVPHARSASGGMPQRSGRLGGRSGVECVRCAWSRFDVSAGRVAWGAMRRGLCCARLL
ncbi:MAG: hypothetical protein GY772_31390 [bacterium]|nr:hypothetical protein [bacterium]